MRDEVKIPLITGIFFLLLVAYFTITAPMITNYTYTGYVDSVEFPETLVYLYFRTDTLVHFNDGTELMFFGNHKNIHIPEGQNVTFYFHRRIDDNSLFLDRFEVNK